MMDAGCPTQLPTCTNTPSESTCLCTSPGLHTAETWHHRGQNCNRQSLPHRELLMLQHPRPATGVSRALRARSVPVVSLGVSLWVPSGPELRSVQKVSRECPRSVKKVSWTLGDTLGTLFGTLRSPGPKGPETPRETLPGHFEGPERLL